MESLETPVLIAFDNSQHVINTLQSINASVKAKHFESYDFSTLYIY